MAASISEQYTKTQGGSSGSYSLTIPAASAAGQERLAAIVGISSAFSTTTFGSVTIDGQAATQIGPYVRTDDGGGGGAGAIVSFWRAAGTSATSVVVAFNVTAGGMFDARAVLWSLNNAGSLFDHTATAVNSPVSGDLSLDVDTMSGGAAAAVFMAYGSSAHAASWIGLTERYDSVNAVGGDGGVIYGSDWYGAADLNVGSSSTPLTVTVDLPSDFTGNQAAAGLALSFGPIASGTTLTAAGGSYILTGSAVIEHFVMPLGAAGA